MNIYKLKKMIKKNTYIIIAYAIIMCVHFLCWKASIKPNIFPDSSGYINFSFQQLITGRTFVYPLYLKIFNLIFGENRFLYMSVLGQEMICLISYFYFWKSLMIISKSEKSSFFILIMYACSPNIFMWNYCILTESLALSLCVIYIYIYY